MVGVLALVAAAVVLLGREPDGDALSASPTASPSSAPAEPSGPVSWVAPEARGAGDGTSSADAADLASVPDLVAGMPQGGRVQLLADQGPYLVTERLVLEAGGSADAPVVVQGVDADGRAADAVLQSDRASPYSADGDTGTDVFTLGAGASHLVFRHLSLHDVGNAFRATDDVSDVVVEDVAATNVRRFFEDAKSSDDRSADVSDLVIRRVQVTGFSKRVLRLRNDSHDVLVEDVVGDSQQQDGDDFAIGVHLEGDVHDVVLRRVSMSNTKDTLHSYWNGDGFATERDVHDVRFEDTSSSGNTDAGYDLKSTRTVLVGAVASDNKRNFRLWSDDVVARDCEGVDPRTRGGDSSPAQVWLGKEADARLEGCTFRGDDPDTAVFVAEPDASVTMVGGSIVRAGDLESTQEGATVELQDVEEQETSSADAQD